MFLEFISAKLAAGPFLRAVVSNSPPGLVNWSGDASQRQWSSCSYRKWPQGGSKSSYTTRVETTRVLGSSWLPGLWIRVESAWANTQGLKYHYFSPKLYSSPPDSCPPGAPLPAEMPRRLHPQEGALSWGPSAGPWIPGDFSLVLEARGSGHHRWGALGILVPAR